MSQDAVVFDTPEGIEFFKLATIRHGLRIEAAGMSLGPLPRTPLQVLRQDYGFTGKTRVQGIAFVSALLREAEEARRV